MIDNLVMDLQRGRRTSSYYQCRYVSHKLTGPSSIRVRVNCRRVAAAPPPSHARLDRVSRSRSRTTKRTEDFQHDALQRNGPQAVPDRSGRNASLHDHRTITNRNYSSVSIDTRCQLDST